MSSFKCPFVCLLPIVTIILFRIGESFLSPRWMKQLDGAKVCIKRLRGLPRIALYIPRTAFIINNSAPTTRRPISYIPLLFSTPVFMDSSPIDSLINKLYPLRTKITFDNVFLLELRINKKCPSCTLSLHTPIPICLLSVYICALLKHKHYIHALFYLLTFWLLFCYVKDTCKRHFTPHFTSVSLHYFHMLLEPATKGRL